MFHVSNSFKRHQQKIQFYFHRAQYSKINKKELNQIGKMKIKENKNLPRKIPVSRLNCFYFDTVPFLYSRFYGQRSLQRTKGKVPFMNTCGNFIL